MNKFILLIVLTPLLFIGCASYNAYQGTTLPPDQVGILKCEGSGFLWADYPFVSSIDGAYFPGFPHFLFFQNTGASPVIQLRPGPHTIHFIIFGSRWGGISITKKLNVIAGKTYLAKIEFHKIQTTDYNRVKANVDVAINSGEKFQAGQQLYDSAPDQRDEATIRASAKHYTSGQLIPGVGTAIGDIYVLPDGGCFGGEGKCGIHWSNGAISMFGPTFSARNPIPLFQAGAPATQ